MFVLALDGLEANLVEEWDLKALKQKTYGTYEISQEYCDESGYPLTPKIWSSFITGQPPSVHKVDKIWKTKNLWSVVWLIRKIHNLPGIKRIKFKRIVSRILLKIGAEPETVKIKIPTIFDKVKPSIPICISNYNDDVLRDIILAMLKGIEELEKESWRVFEVKKQEVYKNLNNEWRLFMVHFHISDTMGHFFIKSDINKIKEIYLMLDGLAYQLKLMLDKDTFFLIVSDHGMKPGEKASGVHTTHGFYSFNQDLDWQPKNPVDFYNKIMELI